MLTSSRRNIVKRQFSSPNGFCKYARRETSSGMVRRKSITLRQPKARPVFVDLKAGLYEQLLKLPRKSPLAEAIRYALDRRPRALVNNKLCELFIGLRKMLEKMPREAAVVLLTKNRLAWKSRYFKRQWEIASKAAGIDDLHFHDLRGTAVTMLSEAGCTVPEIAAITGHSLKSVTGILDKYLSRTRALAHSAILKFENAKATEFANHLQTGAAATMKGESKGLILMARQREHRS